MKVLVTGATGFIGQHVVSYLLAKGVNVRVLVRNTNNLFHSQIEQHVGDLTDPISLQNVADDVDIVLHLAGHAHAWQETGVTEEEKHHRINLQGTKLLLDECTKAKVKKFILFSSIKAVGDSEHCINEQWDAMPDTAYGKAKRHAEELLLKVGKQHNIHVCVLRLSLVFGPGWKGNLHQMLHAIKRGYFLPIPNVKNQRSMVSVYDVCQAAWLAAEKAEANGKIYFVTDKSSYSTYQIYVLMRLALGYKLPRWHIPLWIFKCLAWMGDQIEKIIKKRFPLNTQSLQKLFGSSHYSSLSIQQELGFCPEYSLQKCLPEIIKAHKAERA